MSAVPPHRGNPKLLREPKAPSVVQLLRKPLDWRALLDSGQAANQRIIARYEGVTRARVTQIVGLLRLAPRIHDRILGTPELAACAQAQLLGPWEGPKRARTIRSARAK